MKKLRLNIAISIFILIAMLIGVFAAAGYGVNTRGKNSANDGSVVDAYVSYDNNYDHFAAHSTYQYTDETKFSAYRSGTGSDLTVVEVDSDQPHGSKTNPYVINTTAQWAKFASNSASTNNANTTGKYFVLGSDIDFTASGSFTPVTKLVSRFYGLGHTLKNITYSASASLGVFYNITNGIIADLNVDNLNLTSNSSYMGGLVGSANGGYVMNCHLKGKITLNYNGTNMTYNPAVGGIIGWCGSASAVTVYRCSTMLNAKITRSGTAMSPTYGGILSGVQDTGARNIYDCFSVSKLELSNCTNIWAGGIYGINETDNKTTYTLGTQNIENCVSYFDIISPTTLEVACVGSLFGGWTYNKISINMKNCYSSGTITIGGTSHQMYAATLWSTNKPYTTFKYSNVNWFADSPYFRCNNDYTNTETGGSVYAMIFTTANSNHTRYYGTSSNATQRTQANLFAAAAASTALPGGIWKNKSVINETYMTTVSVTATGGYTVANSPVRNTDIKTGNFTVTYYNYKSGGTDDVLGTSAYNYGSTLQLNQLANKTGGNWIGYTFDKGDGSNPFQTVSDTNYYGDLKLYAVYNAVATTATVTGSGGTDENGIYTTDYGGSITLTANVACSGMTDAQIDYQWRKDGNPLTGNSNTLVLRNVKDSGTYTLYYQIRSASEPLWRDTAWISAGADGTIKVQIKGKSVVFNDANFSVNGKAFIGMPMKDIKYFAEFLDESGMPFVGGSVSWSGGATARIDENSVTETDGKLIYKTQFTYTPDSTITKYENYSPTTFDVEFEVEQPKFVFNMDGIPPIHVVGEYDRAYNVSVIAAEFEKAFLEKLSAGDPVYDKVKKLVPCFDGVEISTYRDGNTNVTLKGNHEIAVTFVDKTYTVTFNYTDENGALQSRPESTYKYGDSLDMTWLSLPTGYVVKQWTFTPEGEPQRAWRFAPDDTNPADYVTCDVTLHGAFEQLNLTLKNIAVTPNGSYQAGTAFTNANIKVVANYETDDGLPYPITLSYGNGQNNTFNVTVVNSPDGLLHVDYNDIIVTHTYNGVTIREPINDLNVTPIEVDTSNCGFVGGRIRYGEKVVLPVVRQRPDGVNSVTYKYFQGLTEITDTSLIVGDPTATVTYTVRAIFNTDSDHTAQDLVVSYVIAAAAEEVYLVWSTPLALPYNGQNQHPEAKAYRVSDDSEVTDVTISYSGDIAVSAIGSYTITASLGDSYDIRSGDETCNFSIAEATVTKPTFTESSMIYNGASQTVVLNDFDDTFMSLSRTQSAMLVGTYTVRVTLTDPNYKFDDGTTTVDIDWNIDKATLTVIWDNFRFEYDGNAKQPKISSLDGLVNGETVDIATEFAYIGDIDKTEVGSYSVTAVATDVSTWTANYKLSGEVRSYAVLPAGMTNAVLITIEWDTTSFMYNGSVQHPTATVKNQAGDVLTDVILTFGGDYNNSIYADTYTVMASVAAPYFILEGKTVEYYITPDADGNGVKPTEPEPVDPDDPGDNDGGFKLPENFPMWQIAVMAVTLILFAVFASKAASFGGRAKRANKEADDYNSRVYSALPIFSSVAVLGLPNSAWSIMAFACAGLMVIGFIAMLVNRKKCLAAEDGLIKAKRDENERRIAAEKAERARRDEEDRRRREEERRQREEEQQKRDDDMKMMLAGMMNMMRGGAGGADTAEIVNQVVSALLPAMQQMLPAGNTAYIPYNTGADDPQINIQVNGMPYDDDDEYADSPDDDSYDDEWDTVLDDDDDDFTEDGEEGEDGERAKRMPANFRMRLKVSSDKNRLWYSAVKNLFCSQKGISYRVSGRVEKFKYEGQLIAVIGIAKRSIKLWLALNPSDFDENRYHQKDVSDKPRFIDVPLYVKVGSERALGRAEELISFLFADKGTEDRKRYAYRDIQELIFTLKNNRLLKDKENKGLLCESVHVHDCDVLRDDVAEACLETRESDPVDSNYFVDVKLDDIDANFCDGQKVTLDALKKKGLVGEEATGYRVIAGSRLSKPLIVIANEFTHPALKMIVLTGGRAIQLV